MRANQFCDTKSQQLAFLIGHYYFSTRDSTHGTYIQMKFNLSCVLNKNLSPDGRTIYTGTKNKGRKYTE